MGSQETGQVTGTKDKDYNVIWFTEQCLSNVLRLETYIEDADREGDSELAELLPPRSGDEPQGRRAGQGDAGEAPRGAEGQTARSSECWKHLALVEVEEAVLVGADLVDVDVVVAGVDVLLDRRAGGARGRGRRRPLGDVVLGRPSRRLLEVRRQRQLLAELPLSARVRPLLQRRCFACLLVLGPADVSWPYVGLPPRLRRRNGSTTPRSAAVPTSPSPIAPRARPPSARRRRPGSAAAPRAACRAGRSRPCSARRGGSSARPPRARGSPRPPPRGILALDDGRGQRSPRMCSLRFSPVPTPRKNVPA